MFVVNVVEVGGGCCNAVFACRGTGQWLVSLRDYIFPFDSSKSVVASRTLPINQKVHAREYLIAPSLEINITNRPIGFDVMLLLPIKRLACLVCCLFVVAPLSAQDIRKQGTLFNWEGSDAIGGPASMSEGLIGDRPDFIEASNTVGLGVKQIEMGYTYSFDNDGTTQVRGHSNPEMLWRLGFYAEWLEMRIGYNFSDSRERTGGVDTTTRGGEDLYLGFKISLTPQDGALPETAMMLQATVPTGDESVTAGETLPAILTYIHGNSTKNGRSPDRPKLAAQLIVQPTAAIPNSRKP